MTEPGGSLDSIIGSGPRTEVPFELWNLRADHNVGSTLTLSERAAATWDADLLAATLEGGGLECGGFEPATSDPFPTEWIRARTLADLVGGDLRVLMVGLNPSLVAADAGVGFAGATNRFWPAAIAAGLVSVDRDPLHAFVHHRVGMSDLVKRATPSAKELSRAEYRSGVERLRRTVAWLRPAIVCVVGITGWRAGVDRGASMGLQPELFGTRPVYVMPNPSGLNAHVTAPQLADQFREVARLADRAD